MKLKKITKMFCFLRLNSIPHRKCDPKVDCRWMKAFLFNRTFNRVCVCVCVCVCVLARPSPTCLFVKLSIFIFTPSHDCHLVRHLVDTLSTEEEEKNHKRKNNRCWQIAKSLNLFVFLLLFFVVVATVHCRFSTFPGILLL